jgi:hypothetical protein
VLQEYDKGLDIRKKYMIVPVFMGCCRRATFEVNWAFLFSSSRRSTLAVNAAMAASFIFASFRKLSRTFASAVSANLIVNARQNFK